MAPLLAIPALPPPAFDIPAVAGTGTHTVRDGETVYGIAARYGTTTRAITQANDLGAGRLIHPGEVLVIPAGDQGIAKRPARTTRTHTVAAGETLSGIAAGAGTTVAAIVKANRLPGAHMIHAGQRLAIPGPVTRVERGFESGSKSTTAPAKGMASRTATRDLITTIATRYGVDPSLALAIAWQESGWQQGVSSHVGAVGVMQVMPGSGTWAAGLIGETLDLHDVRDNVTAGVVIIRQLTRMTETRDEVIAAYYQGLASVRERGWYDDTRQYVANVNYFAARL